MKKRYRRPERFRRGVRRSSNGSERSSGSAGNKYIVIYINYELILIIKCIYLKANRGSNFLMGQISDLGPMKESAFWKRRLGLQFVGPAGSPLPLSRRPTWALGFPPRSSRLIPWRRGKVPPSTPYIKRAPGGGEHTISREKFLPL